MSTQPPPLEVIDYESIRRKLAGLADPDRKLGASESIEVKQVAVRLCTILAHLFGEDLDRKTLWDRIGSGLASGLVKVADSDLDRFVAVCLDHVRASDGDAARCEALAQMLGDFAVRPKEWHNAVLAYIRAHRYPVLVFARQRWEAVKKGEVEL